MVFKAYSWLRASGSLQGSQAEPGTELGSGICKTTALMTGPAPWPMVAALKENPGNLTTATIVVKVQSNCGVLFLALGLFPWL